MDNPGGPVRQMGYLLRVRAERVLAMPKGSVGKTRALHVIAMIERSGASSVERNPGFFYGKLRDDLEKQLKDSNATLQPEESRFKEIMTWHDPKQLRRELRSNLMRLVHAPHDECISIALEMHVLHDLAARVRNGVLANKHHLDDSDFYDFRELRAAFDRCTRGNPQLIVCAAKYGFARTQEATVNA